jgi:xylulokinase
VAAEIDAGIAPEERLRWWGAAMPVDASHAAARMLWMARAEPEVWRATRAVLLPKDYAILRLTGAIGSDPVSNIGLAGRDGAYPEGLLARVPGAAERLPPLQDPRSVAGHWTIAGRKVPVARGLMDAWAGMLGTGAHRDGDAMYQGGTSEILGIVGDAVHPSPGALVFPPFAGIRLHAAPTQSGGSAVGWFCAAFGIGPEAMMAEAAQARRAAVPLFLPHLAGERAPLWDAGARGAFLGVVSDTGRPELARAVLEGVAMSARLALETLDRSAGLRPTTVLCGGGGFRSDLWAQIRADVLGRRLARVAVRDPAVLGAAALAAVAAGMRPDLGAALAGLVRHDRVFAPDPALRALHDDLHALYLPAYEALRATSAGLARLGRA